MSYYCAIIKKWCSIGAKMVQMGVGLGFLGVIHSIGFVLMQGYGELRKVQITINLFCDILRYFVFLRKLVGLLCQELKKMVLSRRCRRVLFVWAVR